MALLQRHEISVEGCRFDQQSRIGLAAPKPGPEGATLDDDFSGFGLFHIEFRGLDCIGFVPLRRHCMRNGVLAPLMQKDTLQYKSLFGLCSTVR